MLQAGIEIHYDRNRFSKYLEWHCTVASNPELVAEMFVHMVPASAAVF